MTPRPRPKAVRLCFGAACLCLLAAVLISVWHTYGRA
ncbi:hypothetical protein OV450_6144 [Actinobacteria bacterium OV450]|nr:hypothetical protein OV450_6144 [Actinobacteria bacterium OV450]